MREEGDTLVAVFVGYRPKSDYEARYASHFSTCPNADDWRKSD